MPDGRLDRVGVGDVQLDRVDLSLVTVQFGRERPSVRDGADPRDDAISRPRQTQGGGPADAG